MEELSGILEAKREEVGTAREELRRSKDTLKRQQSKLLALLQQKVRLSPSELPFRHYDAILLTFFWVCVRRASSRLRGYSASKPNRLLTVGSIYTYLFKNTLESSWRRSWEPSSRAASSDRV
jgi:hypothetical protein